MDLDRTLIHIAAFGGVFSRRRVEILRRRTKSFADYVGVFAVEGAEVLGQVFVVRIPYAFPDGPDRISGIAAVATRADRGRSGIARSLLEEVHRREREAGLRHSALWTNRSWGAHRLYEKLGYQDVYSSPWVIHSPIGPAPRKARRPGCRPGRRADLAEIDRFHNREAADRLGYYRRPSGFSSVEVRLGAMDPARNLIVARQGGELVGYAHFERGPFRVVCGEIVADSATVGRDLVGEVERAAVRLPCAFQHTFVTDAPGIFRGAGYASIPMGWYGMMGNALGRKWTRRQAVDRFGTEDPRFICLGGDRF
jgi:GNAT superfamily N-acetyltransferase